MNKSKSDAALIFEYYEIDSITDEGSSKPNGDNVKIKCKTCGEFVSYSIKANSNLCTHLSVSETILQYHVIIAINYYVYFAKLKK